MRIFFTTLLTWMALSTAFAEGVRNVAEYNLNSAGQGLIDVNTGKAYDPVAYFPEGGGKALPGKAEHAVLYQGVEYLFANAENAKTFLTDPAKYEPTYGGYCARAMVVGQKVEIDAEIFTIHGRRAHFFVSKRAKRFFDRNLVANEKAADTNWKQISGEDPRL